MILITGITGKSGKWLLERLIKEQTTVSGMRLLEKKIRVTLRNSSDTTAIDRCPLDIEKVYGNLDDINFVRSAMDNVTTVLHIAGIYSSLNIVKAAVENNDINWLILVHTTGIFSKYKSASSEYIQIEEEIADLLKNKNIKLTILRPTMIYGSIVDKNVAIFIRMVDKLKFFPLVNNAKYLLQPVHEKDLGNAYFQILVNKEKTVDRDYVLSGKEPIMLIDMLKIIGQYLGKNNIFISVPFLLAYSGGWILYILSFGRVDYREKIQRLVENRNFDHDDAIQDFGYSPVSFEDGVKDEINEYIKNNKKLS